MRRVVFSVPLDGSESQSPAAGLMLGQPASERQERKFSENFSFSYKGSESLLFKASEKETKS